MSEIGRRIGIRVAQVRHDRGMTTLAFAEAAGLSPVAVETLEAGHLQLTAEQMVKVAEVLGVTLTFLFTGRR